METFQAFTSKVEGALRLMRSGFDIRGTNWFLVLSGGLHRQRLGVKKKSEMTKARFDQSAQNVTDSMQSSKQRKPCVDVGIGRCRQMDRDTTLGFRYRIFADTWRSP